MSTALARIRSDGIRLELDGTELVIRSRSPLSDVQIEYLRAHKAELVAEIEHQRRQRRDEVLMQLVDHPGVRYAYVVDAGSDSVMVAMGIRVLATFELTILAERYDGFRLLTLIVESDDT